MKIAIAQISTIPGKIKENTDKIISWISKAADEGAELVVFPELTIPGYCCLDLFLNDDYIEENIEALRKITKSVDRIKVLVGFVDVDRQRIRPDKKLIRYNSAALIQNKKIVALRDKTLLPEYDIFMEKRYFASSRQRGVIEVDGHKLGFQICEDIMPWGYPLQITNELTEQGMEVLINMSASPFSVGKKELRLDWINRSLGKHKVPVVYANCVGGFDGYEGEVVFDGQSLVINGTGEIIAQGKAFAEDLIISDLTTTNIFSKKAREDIDDIYDALVLGIRSYAQRSGFERALLGISGGIDSAVVAALAVAAFGKNNVTLISMPSEFNSEATKVDAKLVAKSLKTKFEEISIQKIFESFKSELGPKLYKETPSASDATYENIQARIRGSLLMAYANRTGSMLLNTGNKTELSLGYCTLYGDMNGALSPLGDVSKSRVYELANYINSEQEIIPTSTIERPPTAELKPDQTDEKGLGAPYSTLSPLVERMIERDSDIEELKKLYDPRLVKELSLKIKNNEFKRRQAPPAIRITEKAFGVGRRMPITY